MKRINNNKNNNKKIIIISGTLLICAIVIATVIWNQKTWKPETEQKRTESSHKTEFRTNDETKETSEKENKTFPVEVKRYGWRHIYKTVPTPGYIWEWAVELENKTPLALNVYIKYILFNEEGIKVAEGKGGELLEGQKTRIIIGQAVAPEEINQAKKSSIEISVSPSRANEVENVERNWHWSDPYLITIE